ncbi:MAG: hypothetical protein PHC64_05650 [Candidatus Gastranaerophilales bacterium]|nr:hypothetical protein [Candidatus Gastranaerophilales bacterium]
MTEQMYSIFNITAAFIIGILMIISGFVLAPSDFEKTKKESR